jgi:hypothetical protein
MGDAIGRDGGVNSHTGTPVALLYARSLVGS